MATTTEQAVSILVVDDSSFTRKRVRQALEAGGYAVSEANSGKAALDSLRLRAFACVLTDLVMPDLDGFGLLSELQKSDFPPPVVVLSADIQKTTRRKCLELGATRFLQKPIDGDALRLVVKEVLIES